MIRTLITIGVIVLAVYALLAVQLTGAEVGEMPADHPDIAQVESLLGGAQIEVLHSFAISGNWSGDIDRGFAGRIENFGEQIAETIELAPAGDQLDSSTEMAVRFLANNFGDDQVRWFPRADEMLSADYRVFTLEVESQGEFIDSARLLIIRPADRMMFYGWVKF